MNLSKKVNRSHLFCVLIRCDCDEQDEEVVWENVRALSNGETVSLTGTHLGHNLPDRYGNRYCINLVSIAGLPVEPTTATETQQS